MWYIEEEDYMTPKEMELEQTIDQAADWYDEVLKILYNPFGLDVSRLENALDELSSYLKCNMPKGDIQVTHKSQRQYKEPKGLFDLASEFSRLQNL